MRFLNSILLLLLASVAYAGPTLEARTGCLTNQQAAKLVDVLVSVSVKFKIADVAPYFTDNFIVQSDSLNFLSGGLLQEGQITASGKSVFLEASYNFTQSQPQPNIKVINIFHACDQIAFRWQSMSKPTPVRGIDIVYVKPGTMKMEKDFSEFNDAADLVNAKLFPCPTATATPKMRFG